MPCWGGVCEIVIVTLVACLSCHVALFQYSQSYQGGIVKMEFQFYYYQLIFTENLLVKCHHGHCFILSSQQLCEAGIIISFQHLMNE